MCSKSFIHHCDPVGKAYLDKAPLFPFSSCFVQSDGKVVIRKLWLLNPLFSPAGPLLLGLILRCFAYKPEESVSGLASASCADTMQQEVH